MGQITAEKSRVDVLDRIARCMANNCEEHADFIIYKVDEWFSFCGRHYFETKKVMDENKIKHVDAEMIRDE